MIDAGRPREEEEGEEEDEADVVREVGLHVGPMPELHGAVSPQKPGNASGLAWPLFGQPSSKQP